MYYYYMTVWRSQICLKCLISHIVSRLYCTLKIESTVYCIGISDIPGEGNLWLQQHSARCFARWKKRSEKYRFLLGLPFASFLFPIIPSKTAQLFFRKNPTRPKIWFITADKCTVQYVNHLCYLKLKQPHVHCTITRMVHLVQDG